MNVKYCLEGLNCAHCAGKIEEKLQSLDNVESARIDFVNQTLSLTLTQDTNFLPTLTQTIQSIEPHVHVKEVESIAPKQHWLDGIEKPTLIKTLIGAIMFGFALSYENFYLYLISYLVIGSDILWLALNHIRQKNLFDENFLMALATIGAMSLGEYPEAVAVMLFYRIGELCEHLALSRSRYAIQSLMDIRPDYAYKDQGGKFIKVSPHDVVIGDTILVKVGDKIPLDGIIVRGESTLDTSCLTGESLPRDVKEGDTVLSGCMNVQGVLVVRVTETFSNSTASKIIDLVQNASHKKAITENFITSFSKIYTPLIVLGAMFLAFIPPLVMSDALLSDWLHRALVFLVISCPCALVISIPLTFFAGIGAASSQGILVKGGNYLEALHQVDTIVFDKTGTLTHGSFHITDIHLAPLFTKEEALYFASYAEYYSSHPIARSIVNSYKEVIDESRISSHQELAGFGVESIIDGHTIKVGNSKLVSSPFPNSSQTSVNVSYDGEWMATIVLQDNPKDEAFKTLQELKELGIQRIIMLTGDTQESAMEVAKTLNITTVYASLLPHEKVKQFEAITPLTPTSKHLFIGDGMNDAPVIARADVGMAMGGMGSPASIEVADVVIMNDNLSCIVQSLKLAHKTHMIVWQNIILALGIKGVILIMGAMGIATMWEAVFGDVGVALLAILNASRMLNKK